MTGDRSTNPFLRFRDRLDAYRPVRAGLMSDERFVEIVDRLDRAVADVWGRGFDRTPVVDGTALARAGGLDVDLRIKVEIDNVGGSHKARHLFGVALDLLVERELGGEGAAEGGHRSGRRLAIASCGNAALAAGVIAAALDRPLDVYVPTWADPTITTELERLGAVVNRCPRIEGESGDPAYSRFLEAVADGARPFSVQGDHTPTTFDGGRTLGWELAEQVPELDRIYVQVGGGALAVSAHRGLRDAGLDVELRPVQAEGCAPLRRAWDRLEPDFDFEAAATDPEAYMWPWDNPKSRATGILDDVTYDWLPLLEATRDSGGKPVVAPERTIETAHELARSETEIPVEPTGTAGLAGLLHDRPGSEAGTMAVLFTGVQRSAG